MNYEDCISDENCQRVHYQNIARINKANKTRYECPTCKTKNALSAYQKSQGYQCDACANREEGCF